MKEKKMNGIEYEKKLKKAFAIAWSKYYRKRNTELWKRALNTFINVYIVRTTTIRENLTRIYSFRRFLCDGYMCFCFPIKYMIHISERESVCMHFHCLCAFTIVHKHIHTVLLHEHGKVNSTKQTSRSTWNTLHNIISYLILTTQIHAKHRLYCHNECCMLQYQQAIIKKLFGK